MKRKKLAARSFLISGVLTLFILPLTAQAFEINTLANMPVEGDYVIGPGKIELFLDPGQSASRDLKVTNRTGQPLNIFIEIEDFTGDPVSSTRLLGKEAGPYSLRDFIHPEKESFVLAHGEKATLPVTISIPETAEPGGLYGAAIFTAKPVLTPKEEELEGAKGQVSITTRLATLFFVRINGPVNEAGYLKSFTAGKKFYQTGPIDFSVIYENTGSVHNNPYGQIEIKNLMGKTIDSLDITPYFVMPGFSRDKVIAWNSSLAFGRYTATLKLNRGYSNIIDEAEANFWVVPIKILIIGLAVIIFIAIFIWWFTSRFELRKKNNKEPLE